MSSPVMTWTADAVSAIRSGRRETSMTCVFIRSSKLGVVDVGSTSARAGAVVGAVVGRVVAAVGATGAAVANCPRAAGHAPQSTSGPKVIQTGALPADVRRVI